MIWYPQIFRTRRYQSTEDLIPGGYQILAAAAGRSGGVLREYIIMMEDSGLEMDVGNTRPASLESVNRIELNEHWNEEIALSFNSTWCEVDIQMGCQ